MRWLIYFFYLTLHNCMIFSFRMIIPDSLRITLHFNYFVCSIKYIPGFCSIIQHIKVQLTPILSNCRVCGVYSVPIRHSGVQLV